VNEKKNKSTDLKPRTLYCLATHGVFQIEFYILKRAIFYITDPILRIAVFVKFHKAIFALRTTGQMNFAEL